MKDDPDNAKSAIRFFRSDAPGTNIKISRGEEHLFIWCFFLAILQTLKAGDKSYSNWVKYIYIDDPISSLDDNNVISVAVSLAALLKDMQIKVGIVISTHHNLFFDVLSRQFSRAKLKQRRFLLKYNDLSKKYELEPCSKPFFLHLDGIKTLCQAIQNDTLSPYHFDMLRSILEQCTSFCAGTDFSDCFPEDRKEEFRQIINNGCHGDVHLNEISIMNKRQQETIKETLKYIKDYYGFNSNLFP